MRRTHFVSNPTDDSTIEDHRRRRESAFERCSERVRIAKENGLWRTTSWGGGFQQYKGQYDEDRPKKTSKEKGIHVQWSLQRQNVADEDEPVVQVQYVSITNPLQ
ncbi:hypothetical protein Angca_001597 [Angiostrongylus cantonensis]|nr:hypothetical protein Angca_001597 [Angiostrongylus cantonensis]